MVRGVTIEFTELPSQFCPPRPFRLNQNEKEILDEEISKLRKKGVIEPTLPCEGQIISNVFLRPKQDGQYRLILDLTETNKSVEYQHFKMSSFQTALDLMRPGAWIATVDLKDAYFSVPVAEGNRKYLKFLWNNKLFQFLGLPNGLACAPRLFTKILQPVWGMNVSRI